MINSECIVRFHHTSYPYWGVLVDENENIVKELNINCGDFKNRRFRYKHLKWPSPNRDFIPITVELIDLQSKWVVKSERHFIQVDVIGKFSQSIFREKKAPAKFFIFQKFKKYFPLLVRGENSRI